MNQSLVQAIRQVWAAVNSGSGIAFPETVQRLTALGVQRYHVDFVASTVTAYAGREVDVAPIPSHLPASTSDQAFFSPWDVAKVRGAIQRVQKGELSYGEFSTAILDGGCTNYWAFLEGKRVIYMSPLGDLHTEWFPGAAPKTD